MKLTKLLGWQIASLVIAPSILVTACSYEVQETEVDNRSDSTTQPVTQAPEGSAETAIVDTAQEREEYEEEIEEKLDNYEQWINGMEIKMKLGGSSVKSNVKEKLNELEQQQEALEQKFQALRTSRGEAWREMKSDIEVALVDLKKSCQKTENQLQGATILWSN